MKAAAIGVGPPAHRRLAKPGYRLPPSDRPLPLDRLPSTPSWRGILCRWCRGRQPWSGRGWPAYRARPWRWLPPANQKRRGFDVVRLVLAADVLDRIVDGGMDNRDVDDGGWPSFHRRRPYRVCSGDLMPVGDGIRPSDIRPTERPEKGRGARSHPSIPVPACCDDVHFASPCLGGTLALYATP